MTREKWNRKESNSLVFFVVLRGFVVEDRKIEMRRWNLMS